MADDTCLFQFELPDLVSQNIMQFCIDHNLRISDFFGGCAIHYLLDYEMLVKRNSDSRNSVDSLSE